MKNKILIEDNRLTPTMRRSRSGRTQIFIEESSKEEIRLEHEKKSMYAELIDGRWYWVEGCAECKGEERDWMTYVECEEHDRCRTCGTNRKDIKGIPWGGKKGWQCQSCADARQKEIRREAFKKFNEEKPDEYDFNYMDEIKCPHCGSKLSNNDIHESQNIDCNVCEGELFVEVEYTPSYSTSIVGKRVTK